MRGAKGARGGRWLTCRLGGSKPISRRKSAFSSMDVMDLFMIAGSLTSRAGCIAFGIPSCSKNVNLGSMLFVTSSLKNCGDFLNTLVSCCLSTPLLVRY